VVEGSSPVAWGAQWGEPFVYRDESNDLVGVGCGGKRRPDHGRMARGGHKLPEVSLGPAMPYLPTPCRRATPETGNPSARP
jgi:hypothetical protein